MEISIGQEAPDFALPDQENRVHQLSAYRGKWVLLYFYPKDHTPGCTVEAQKLRDAWGSFARHNTNVLGVSADPVSTHKSFAEKHQLPFPILSDPDHKVLTAYSVWGRKKFLGKTLFGIKRTSFLLDPQGRVMRIYKKVKPANHANEVLADLTKLQA